MMTHEWEDQRSAFRLAWRSRHNRSIRYRYPSKLLSMQPFVEWLYNHIRKMRAEGFSLPRNLVQLSYPPSTFATSWWSMYVREVLFRCSQSEGGPVSHTTFDYGVTLKNSESGNNIDVKILKQILMVDYGKLKPVFMEALWVKRVSQGQNNIKKDQYGFWTCKLQECEDPTLRNPYIFPSHNAQVFFMND